MRERDLQEAVRDLAKLYGWRYFHVWRSTRSPAGFPDAVLVKPPRLLFCELKSEDGRLTQEQTDWLADLGAIAMASRQRDAAPLIETYVWRPHNWDEIVRILARDAEGKSGPRGAEGEQGTKVVGLLGR